MTTTIRNADATRYAVLNAAEELFSEQGFAGTSMRELAKASGVSQPLIYHHFGSKQALYVEVKRRVLQRYAAQHDDESNATNRPVDLKLEVERLHTFLQNNKTLLRLSAWSRLEGDDSPWPGEAELMETLRQRIEVAQQRGTIRRDLDPRNLVIMLAAITYHWSDYRSYYAGNFSTPRSEGQFISETVAVLTRGASPAS